MKIETKEDLQKVLDGFISFSPGFVLINGMTWHYRNSPFGDDVGLSEIRIGDEFIKVNKNHLKAVPSMKELTIYQIASELIRLDISAQEVANTMQQKLREHIQQNIKSHKECQHTILGVLQQMQTKLKKLVSRESIQRLKLSGAKWMRKQ
jgi:hypothetical protein